MKRNIIIVLLLVVAFVGGYFIGDASAVKNANEKIALMEKEIESNIKEVVKTEPITTKPIEWKEVTTFEGESIKDTETFTITSNEWRIIWETEPGKNGDMNFQIYVYNEDGSPADTPVVANVIGKGNDTSIIRGSGNYYLTINTGQPYKITIEENK